MAVLFKSFQSNIANKAGKKLYYPRAVRVATVGTDQVAKDVAAYSSLTPGDVQNVIDNLITVMTTHLQASESVTLDGLGTFRMVIKAGGNGVETAEEVSAQQAKVMIRFAPTSTRNSNGTRATRAQVTGVKGVRVEGGGESGNSGGTNKPGSGNDNEVGDRVA